MKKKIIISSLICLAASIVILFFAQALLVPKYVSTSPEGALTAEYYAAAKETAHFILVEAHRAGVILVVFVVIVKFAAFAARLCALL